MSFHEGSAFQEAAEDRRRREREQGTLAPRRVQADGVRVGKRTRVNRVELSMDDLRRVAGAPAGAEVHMGDGSVPNCATILLTWTEEL